MSKIDEIRQRLQACPIPEGANADWQDTEHWEVNTPEGGGLGDWLMVENIGTVRLVPIEDVSAGYVAYHPELVVNVPAPTAGETIRMVCIPALRSGLSRTEEGERLGAMLDYACHYRADVAALLARVELLTAALEQISEMESPDECGSTDMGDRAAKIAREALEAKR